MSLDYEPYDARLCRPGQSPVTLLISADPWHKVVSGLLRLLHPTAYLAERSSVGWLLIDGAPGGRRFQPYPHYLYWDHRVILGTCVVLDLRQLLPDNPVSVVVYMCSSSACPFTV